MFTELLLLLGSHCSLQCVRTVEVLLTAEEVEVCVEVLDVTVVPVRTVVVAVMVVVGVMVVVAVTVGVVVDERFRIVRSSFRTVQLVSAYMPKCIEVNALGRKLPVP